MQTVQAAVTAPKENHISTVGLTGMQKKVQAVSAMQRGVTAAVAGDATAAVIYAEQAAEVGADMVEEGIGEEEVAVIEGASETGAQGLFGGAAAGAAGLGSVAATGGLALAGVAGSTESNPSNETMVQQVKALQVAKAESEGINIGPSNDGSVLISGGETSASLVGSATPNITLKNLSVLNPEAGLPSGLPVNIDPTTQNVSINLGPLAQTELDISIEKLQDALVGFIVNGASSDIALDQLARLEIPTSIAGMEIPVTDTLNDVLAQLDTALSPVLDQLQIAPGQTSPIDQLLQAGADAPLLGDVLGQLDSALAGGLPTGPLPIPADIPNGLPDIPNTGTPLDLVTGQINNGISSLAQGQVPLSDLVTNIIPA